MSSLELHPHFVAARNLEDVKTIVNMLQDPFDDKDFEQPDDAPFLPAAYTSTIHVGESHNNGQFSARTTIPNTSRDSGSLRRRDNNADDADGFDNAHIPFGDDAADLGRSPLAGETDEGRSPLMGSLPKVKAPPASTTEFKMRRRASSHHRPGPRQPKVLCIWDVDDTLVATGVSGVRQNPVFREPELVALFRSAGPNARHLLLSQGSIDDVFDEPGGRLRCVQKFVQRPPPTTEVRRRAPSAARSSSRSKSASNANEKSGASRSSAPAPKKSSFADLLRCGSGRQVKQQPSSSSGFPSNKNGGGGKNAEFGVGGTDERDMRHLAKGTVVVRLSSMRDRAEEPKDSAFLTDPNASPTCARDSTKPMDEKGERMGRWLILRPEVWGITLASMNTIFPPSRNTAFVNGKVYRKMDVVWSLAMTGEWDSVFFIDNNLSEVGVVRYGLQMSDMLNLRSGHRAWRFFQSEFLLLAASAKLREMQLRYGRDVTKPPPKPDENKSSSPGVVDLSTKAKGGADVQEGGELTPSKSAATSSTDSRAPGGGRGLGGNARDRQHRGSGESGPAQLHIDVVEDIHIVDLPGAAAAAQEPSSGRKGGASVSNGSEDLSLTSSPALPAHGGGAASPRLVSTAAAHAPAHSCKDVDLVVVNLHMSCKDYRRVLTTARTNSDGQRSLQREGSLPPRYVGQPTFMGDRSCTDEQYEAILKLFKETESGLFQLLEEEMRMHGYVDTKLSNRYIPGIHTVYAPIPKRPDFIPHMLQYYQPFFDTVEKQVVLALQKYGGTSASCTLHTEAQLQYFALQRLLTFIDPYLTGDLGRILFDIYIVDGTIPRSLADQLKKILGRTRARLIHDVDKKR